MRSICPPELNMQADHHLTSENGFLRIIDVKEFETYSGKP